MNIYWVSMVGHLGDAGLRGYLPEVGPCPRVIYLIAKELEDGQVNTGISYTFRECYFLCRKRK